MKTVVAQIVMVCSDNETVESRIFFLFLQSIVGIVNQFGHYCFLTLTKDWVNVSPKSFGFIDLSCDSQTLRANSALPLRLTNNW